MNVNLFSKIHFLFSIYILFLFVACSELQGEQSPINFDSLTQVDDIVLIDNDYHNAFTDLQKFNGQLYLAYRQARGHIPKTTQDYGSVKILLQSEKGWHEYATIQKKDWDLRDPKLYVFQNKLCVLCGYSYLVNSKLEKQGTCISFCENGTFTEPLPVKTDADHSVWIWRMCVIDGMCLGIGYLEGYKPLLLESNNLFDWRVLSELPVEGIPTEADVTLYDDTIMVVLRRDGETAYFCSKPMESTDWRCIDMGLQFDSPCIGYVDENSIVVAGRLYKEDKRETGILNYKYHSNKYKILDATSINSPDCAYPGIGVFDNSLYMSYYEGNYTKAKIHIRSYK